MLVTHLRSAGSLPSLSAQAPAQAKRSIFEQGLDAVAMGGGAALGGFYATVVAAGNLPIEATLSGGPATLPGLAILAATGLAGAAGVYLGVRGARAATHTLGRWGEKLGGDWARVGAKLATLAVMAAPLVASAGWLGPTSVLVANALVCGGIANYIGERAEAS